MPEKEKKPPQEKEVASISQPLRTLYPWVKDIAQGRMLATLEKKRSPYLGEALPEYPEEIAETYAELSQDLIQKEKRLNALRDKLLSLWAQKGVSEIGGVKIVPAPSIEFHYAPALGKLPQTLRKQVMRNKLVFDMQSFLKLVDEGKIDRDLIEENISVDMNILVRAPKK